MHKLFKYSLFRGLRRFNFADDGGESGGGGAADGGGDSGLSDGSDAHWGDDHDGISSNADLHEWSKKFKTVGAMAESGRELEQRQSKSFRLPENLADLNPEQQADLLSKTRTLRDIPETPEEYEIEVPEGVPKNEEFEAAFRALAHEKQWSKRDVKDMAAFYHTAMKGAIDAHRQQLAEAAQAADTEYRMHSGTEYDANMEHLAHARMNIAQELGLGYKNDKGELCSKLDDALDTVDVNGNKLGNQVPILQLLTWVRKKGFVEGKPIEGAGGEGKAKGADPFGFPEMDQTG